MLDPLTIPMFHFTGKKRSTPNCPVKVVPKFLPGSGSQSYSSSNKGCTRYAKYKLPFFLKNLGPKYNAFSVAAHEARPGHHTQVSYIIILHGCYQTISTLHYSRVLNAILLHGFYKPIFALMLNVHVLQSCYTRSGIDTSITGYALSWCNTVLLLTDGGSCQLLTGTKNVFFCNKRKRFPK